MIKSQILALFTICILIFSCSEDEPTISELTMPTSFTASIDENSPSGTIVLDMSSTVRGSGAITYSIIGATPSGALKIEGSKLVVDGSVLIDYEARTEITGIIEASVEDLVKTAPFTVTINDLADGVPELNMPGNISVNVDENSPSGTEVVDLSTLVTGSGEITYRIVGSTPSGILKIEGSKMVIDNPTFLDHESRTEITGILQAKIGAVSKTADFTVRINDIIDDISDVLTSSLTSYNSLGNDEWLEITAAEYGNLATKLRDVSIGAIQDADLSSESYFVNNYTQSVSSTSDNSVVINQIPTQSYVFAFKFVSYSNSHSGLKLKASTTSATTGFNDVADDISIATSSEGEVHYFVNKATVKFSGNAYTGIYTGTGQIGGILTTNAVRYFKSGDITDSSVLGGPASNNIPSYQTLNTTIKQW